MNLEQTRLVILSAPSGTGKTTILRELMARVPQLAFSVSATTRPPRAQEVDGRDYYFLSEADFRRRIAAGEFIEWEEVYPGRFYGTLWSEIERIVRAGRVPIFELDANGGVNLKQRFGPAALAIFLEPPSLEVLSERLRKRGTEDALEIEVRLQKATQELELAAHYDRRILNDDLTAALDQLTEAIRAFLGS